METFVSNLLENADLNIITKKHVRVLYKQTIGRELTADEKSRITDLVNEFVRDLAEKQKKSSSSPHIKPQPASHSPGNNWCGKISTNPDTKPQPSSPLLFNKLLQKNSSNPGVKVQPALQSPSNNLFKKISSNPGAKPPPASQSPGNKENEHCYKSPGKFIIKGHIVNRADLYKPAVKAQDKARDKVNQQQSTNRQPKLSLNEKSANLERNKFSSPKMTVNEVVTAILDDVNADLTSSDSDSLCSTPSDNNVETLNKYNGKKSVEKIRHIRKVRDRSPYMATEKISHENDKDLRRNSQGIATSSDGVCFYENKTKVEPKNLDSFFYINEDEDDEVHEQFSDSSNHMPECLGIVDEQPPCGHVKRDNLGCFAETYGLCQQNSDKNSGLETKATIAFSEKRALKDAYFEIDLDDQDQDKKLLPSTRRIQRGNNVSRSNLGVKTPVKDIDSEDEYLSKVSAKLALRKKQLITIEDKKSSDSDFDFDDAHLAFSKSRPVSKEKQLLPRTGRIESNCSELSGIKKRLIVIDSEDECLNKVSEKLASRCLTHLNTSEFIMSDSESDRVDDVSLVKKRLELREDNSDQNTRDMSSVKKNMSKYYQLLSNVGSEQSDSVSDSGNKKCIKMNKICNHSVKKKSASDMKNNSFSSDSEGSSGDTPLIKMKRQQQYSEGYNSDIAEFISLKNRSAVDSDSKTRINNSKEENEIYSINSELDKYMKQSCLCQIKLHKIDGRSARESDSDTTSETLEFREEKGLKNKPRKIGKANSHKNNKRKKRDSSNSYFENDGFKKIKMKVHTCDSDNSTEHTIASLSRLDLPEKVILTSVNCNNIDNDTSLKTVATTIRRSRSCGGISKSTKFKSAFEHIQGFDSDDGEHKKAIPLDTNEIPDSSSNVDGYSSSDDDLPLSTVCIAHTATNEKSKVKESHNMKRIKKICRASGMFIRNDRELKGCTTDDQKVSRLKDLLKKAGMTGQPNMKKAEELRLQKEAADLDSKNILSAITS